MTTTEFVHFPQLIIKHISSSAIKTSLIIPSLNGHIPCSAFTDTGSPVTKLSEKLQRQLNLPVTPLDSHFHLVEPTSDSLTTMGTA